MALAMHGGTAWRLLLPSAPTPRRSPPTQTHSFPPTAGSSSDGGAVVPRVAHGRPCCCRDGGAGRRGEGGVGPGDSYAGEKEPAAARGGVCLDEEEDDDGVGTRWAVLVAGSNGYGNYTHQVSGTVRGSRRGYMPCIPDTEKGRTKEENIVVFMYDDVANSALNPRPGVIINHPEGEDVYAGVPKDYTGSQVTAKNFYAVLLGNKTAVTGSSRKVIDSKPNDHIFIYYSDHGGPGVLGT
ncbi:hypothetical protein EJB05_20563, partial [Eragrostis curvula]